MKPWLKMSLADHSTSSFVRHGGRALRRAATTWLAILGLLVHVAAAGACTMGERIDAQGAHGPFPICHAHHVAAEEPKPGPDRAPLHHDECPFCALHCHAALALPHVLAAPTPVRVVSSEPSRARSLPSAAPRCHAGVSPRGPPRIV